jgi:hypothetical protein
MVNILLDLLKHLSQDGLKVYVYVILENHCHFVVQSTATTGSHASVC